MTGIHLHQNALAYSATTVAASLMNAVFQFYYVNLFLNVYRISEAWFNKAQLIYLVWNSINDPLFGYFQDHSNIPILKHRRMNILYGAPLFILSFLLPWFGWSVDGQPDWLVGLHLTISLCFYDGMFTFVVLAQCSLFAEISTAQEERETVLKYSQVASIIGSSSVLFCEFISDHMTRLYYLQGACLCIAVLSYFLLRFSGNNLKPAIDRGDENLMKDLDEHSYDQKSLIKLTKEIFSQKNFLCFVIMNFFQVFHVTFISNFFGIFRDHLIVSDMFPSTFKSLMAGSAFVLPQLVVLLSGRLISQYGSYTLIMWSFYAKVLLSLFMYLIGPSYIWLLAAFMLIDATLPSAAFSLFNFSVTDIIEEDSERFKRRRPISSMIFGTNALVTKPAQSIAPMLIVYVLGIYGYKTQKVFGQKLDAKNDHSADIETAMFNLLCFIPAMVGVIQIIIWRVYNIRKKGTA